MTNKIENNEILSTGIQFSLFTTSYFPLFLLIIVKQISQNYEYLNWGGVNIESLKVFFLNFGISSILIPISVYGLIGIYFSFKNFNEYLKEGDEVTIKDVKNRNSESISYIGTYIIPFLFQNYSTFYELFAITFLLFVIYKIYINSSLLLINPLLNIKYSIYEIDFIDKEKINKSGMVIMQRKNLEEENEVRIVKIGHKLYYSK